MAGTSGTSRRPPAGWYLDPAGQSAQRWWDGSHWTDHTRTYSPRLRDPSRFREPIARNSGELTAPYQRVEYQTAYGAAVDRRNWQVGSHGGTILNSRSSEFGRKEIAKQSEQAPQNSERTSAQIVLGLSAALCMAIALLAAGYVFDVGALRLTGVLGVLFFGIGAAPLQLSVRPSLTTRLGVAGVVGLSTVTLLGSVMVLTPLWHPTLVAAVLVLAAVIVHARAYRRVLAEVSISQVILSCGVTARATLNSSVACTLGGTALWLGAAIVTGHVAPGVGGFLPKVLPVWYGGLVLLIAAVALARGKSEFAGMAALVSLVSALTLTPALLYNMPRSESAGKHIYLVQQILQAHHLDRTTGIYEAYSGFFSAIAWLCDLARISDSVSVATFWPFIVGLIGLAELRYFFGKSLSSNHRVSAGMTLVVLVDAIGADYFSPQSVGFVLGLGVYGLALGSRRSELNHGARIALMVLAGCALSVTHELSPYIVGGVLVVLAAFRVIRPWYAAASSIIPAILWALLNKGVLSGFISFSGLGNVSNFAPPKTVATPGLQRLAIVGYSSHALLFGLLVLIALAFAGFIRMAPGRSAWAFLISTGVGLSVVTVNSYGNEGIFRSALFGIPWLAMLATAAVPRNPGRLVSVVFGMTSLVLLSTFLLAMFGLDNAGVIEPAEIQAFNIYKAQAPMNSFLLDLSYGDVPVSVTFPRSGHLIAWTTMMTRADVRPGRLTAVKAAALAQRYITHAKHNGGASPDGLYALWSPPSAEYSVDYGLETLAQAEAWRELLTTSPDWHVVFRRDGTYLFRVVMPKRHVPRGNG